jgi:hypothetical protein
MTAIYAAIHDAFGQGKDAPSNMRPAGFNVAAKAWNADGGPSRNVGIEFTEFELDPPPRNLNCIT